MITKTFRMNHPTVEHTKLWEVTDPDEAAVIMAAFGRGYEETVANPHTGQPEPNMPIEQYALERFDKMIRALVEREVDAYKLEQIQLAATAVNAQASDGLP